MEEPAASAPISPARAERTAASIRGAPRDSPAVARRAVPKAKREAKADAQMEVMLQTTVRPEREPPPAQVLHAYASHAAGGVRISMDPAPAPTAIEATLPDIGCSSRRAIATPTSTSPNKVRVQWGESVVVDREKSSRYLQW